MRLQSLSLHGFKSFADRTLIDVRDGLTVIVGSNGCGKSNVADAVRWVLGEQKASALRGARMDEVIFQGTRARRPVQMAEVSLLFSNEEGRLAVPQSEIEVQRKVFREGGSEYSLNGTACRLRDIQDLLRDTGLGSDAYSIIEGSMIETILSDRTEERRTLFEEAAGIGGYKESRRVAARKLERADADLTRLDDLIREVESKVRSLARQRGRAQRYRDLRERKLALDVSIARAEIEAMERAEADRKRALEEADRSLESTGAARAAVEAELDGLKAEAGLLAGQRRERAEGLEEVQRSVEAEERAILVTDERRRAAEDRIGDLEEEKETLLRRIGVLRATLDQQDRDRLEADERASELERRHANEVETVERVRERLQSLRRDADDRTRRAREAAARVTELEASRGAIATGREDAERRLESRADRLEEVKETLARASSQAELFERTVEEAELEVGVRHQEATEAAHLVEDLRSREQGIVEETREAEARLAELQASVGALESILDSDEDLSPAAAELLRLRSRFPGVHGPLAEFVDVGDDARAARLDHYLGGLGRAIVVQDRETVARVRDWFHAEWGDGGALYLLPLDAPGLGSGAAGGIGQGAGSAWVDALLRDVDLDAPVDPLDADAWGGPAVGEDGTVVDARGVVRLASEREDAGVFARRERLARLRAQQDEAHAQLSGTRSRLTELRRGLDEAKAGRHRAEARLREAEDVLRSARGDATSHEERERQRTRELEELVESVTRLEAEIRAGEERAREIDGELEDARAELHESSERSTATSSALAEVEAEWERVRSEETETRVELARVEAAARDARMRLEGGRAEIRRAEERLAEIDRIVGRIRAESEEHRTVRERASANLEAAFARRDEARRLLSELDVRLADLEERVGGHEKRLRDLRAEEGRIGERRHALQLEETSQEATRDRLRERVEVEWGRPWDALVEQAADADDGEPDDWREEVAVISGRLERLGPINMLAIEEYEEESKRLEFLNEQREDLVAAREDLSGAIQEINRTARAIFLETFEAARENFRETFTSLFDGGECDVWLADPDDPLESDIEIHASPKGKRTKRLSQLSGGERALTALSLLFGIYLVKPSPFCVLDEVDAPLDESNVGRFVRMLERFKERTQFVVITHNPRTMEAADWIYGVTMEEPGVSTIVGVELEEAREYGEQVA